MSQTETLTVAPSTGINAFSLSKGADKVAVCHVPDGNDAHDAIYMEVGAKAAEAHLNNHAGDRTVALGASCDAPALEQWELWRSWFAAAGFSSGAENATVSGCNGINFTVTSFFGDFWVDGVYYISQLDSQLFEAVGRDLATKYTFCDGLVVVRN